VTTEESLNKTALFQMHIDADAKMVPFTGYHKPVQYPSGIIKEHLHTREKAGLFDVSHMGQITVKGEHVAQLLETLIPVDIVGLAPGKQRYGLFLNDQGGVIDDLMISTISETEIKLVVNAACKHGDYKHLTDKLGNQLDISLADDKSLLALQGPTAKDVFERLGHDLSSMNFMDVTTLEIDGIRCNMSRSGYTGEDGFEISVDNVNAEALAKILLNDDDVKWVGLGARDSLRLEAGLCLYGHDMNEQTTPIEANLLWAISKIRRSGGERSGGFPGADIILPQIPKNVDKILVGLKAHGRAPIREGAIIEDQSGNEIGVVTSGGFSPSLGHPICIGYIGIDHNQENSELNAVVRDKRLPVSVIKLPFVQRRYYRIG
jgi:aminomethyltransferase